MRGEYVFPNLTQYTVGMGGFIFSFFDLDLSNPTSVQWQNEETYTWINIQLHVFLKLLGEFFSMNWSFTSWNYPVCGFGFVSPRNIKITTECTCYWEMVTKLCHCSTAWTYVDLKIPFGLDVYENGSVESGMLPFFAIKGPYEFIISLSLLKFIVQL